jgi:hypothetical protein
LIDSALDEVAACRRQVHRRPFRTWRRLYEATDRLSAASNRLTRAMRDLGRTSDCIARDPENTTKVPAFTLVLFRSEGADCQGENEKAISEGENRP